MKAHGGSVLILLLQCRCSVCYCCIGTGVSVAGDTRKWEKRRCFDLDAELVGCSCKCSWLEILHADVVKLLR